MNEEKLKKEEDYHSVYSKITSEENFSIDYFNHCIHRSQEAYEKDDKETLIHSLKEICHSLLKKHIEYDKVVDLIQESSFLPFLINSIQQGFSPFSFSLSFTLLQIIKIPPQYRIEIIDDNFASALTHCLVIPEDDDQKEQEIILLQTLQRTFCVDNYSTELILNEIQMLDSYFQSIISFPELINELLNVFSAILLIQNEHYDESFPNLVFEKSLQVLFLKDAQQGICYVIASLLSINQEFEVLLLNNQSFWQLLEKFQSINDAFLALIEQAFRSENEAFVTFFFNEVPWSIIAETIGNNREFTYRACLFFNDFMKDWPCFIPQLETIGIIQALTNCAKQSDYKTAVECIDCIIESISYISTDSLTLMLEKGFINTIGIIMSSDDEIERFIPLLGRILHLACSILGPNAVIVSQEYDENEIDELLEDCEFSEENFDSEATEIIEMAATLRQYREEKEEIENY